MEGVEIVQCIGAINEVFREKGLEWIPRSLLFKGLSG